MCKLLFGLCVCMNNLLIASACYIARYLTLVIRKPMEGAIGQYYILFVLLNADDTVVLGTDEKDFRNNLDMLIVYLKIYDT